MSQDLQEKLLCLRVSSGPPDEEDNFSPVEEIPASFFTRKRRECWSITKLSSPVIVRRLLNYALDLLVYTGIAARQGSDLLAEITLPLTIVDSSYYIISVIFGKGMNIVRGRMRNQDALGVAEYSYAALILGAGIPVIIVTPMYVGISYLLGLSSRATWFGAGLIGDLVLRNWKMIFRHLMIGIKLRVNGISGDYIFLGATGLEAVLFSGFSMGLVPQIELWGFGVGKYCGSLSTVTACALLLAASKRVFLRPRAGEIFNNTKMILCDGLGMSGQIFFELLVLNGVPFIFVFKKAKNYLAAFQIARTYDGFTGPFAQSLIRGWQRVASINIMENLSKLRTTFVMTTVASVIPLLIYWGIPRQLASVFTHDPEVLDVFDSVMNIMRTFSLGQCFYSIYSALQSALWVLFNDSTYSLGSGFLNAVMFFGITVSLMETDTGGLDSVMGVYALCLGINLFSLLAQYLCRERSALRGDAENMGIFGLFKNLCCSPREPRVAEIEHTRSLEEEGIVFEFK